MSNWDIINSEEIGMSENIAGKEMGNDRVVAREAEKSDHSPDDEFDWRAFDPAMLKGGSKDPLATELITDRDRLDELLCHEGLYVVLKGRVIGGYFRDRKSATAAAIAQYGPGPVLIKKVVEREPICRIGHAILC